MSHHLPYPTLMLVTDRHRSVTPLVEAVLAAVAAGVDLVQLRDPDLDDGEIERLARELSVRVGPERLILNGRPALARRLGVGVHLRDGQVDDGSGVDGPRPLRGQSVHEISPIPPRVLPDYLLAGNVFPTRTHPGRPGHGVAWLSKVVRSSQQPVLAVGGIGEENVMDVMRSGCHGVAVIDAILATPDPAAAATTLRRLLDQAADNSRATGVGSRRVISSKETA